MSKRVYDFQTAVHTVTETAPKNRLPKGSWQLSDVYEALFLLLLNHADEIRGDSVDGYEITERLADVFDMLTQEQIIEIGKRLEKESALTEPTASLLLDIADKASVDIARWLAIIATDQPECNARAQALFHEKSRIKQARMDSAGKPESAP